MCVCMRIFQLHYILPLSKSINFIFSEYDKHIFLSVRVLCTLKYTYILEASFLCHRAHNGKYKKNCRCSSIMINIL